MLPVSPVIPDKDHKAIIVAEHQDEYENLPVIVLDGGVLLSRWELSDEELKQINESKSIYMYLHTFFQPAQPCLLTTQQPEIIYKEAD